MKRFTLHRLTAVILAVCLTLGLAPAKAYSANDLSNHWARAYIEKLSAQNVLSGYDDGSVQPDLPITRAEFITMINRVFGFVEKADNRFADISTDDWFLPEIQKAVKAGYITGYDGYARPKAPITREEAAVAMFKAFGLPPGQAGALAFADRDKISSWAKEAVASLVELKYISGYPNGSFNPQGQITRAEAATIVSRFAGEIYSKEGTYFGKGVTVKNNVIINTPDVILANITIDGDLYIAPGVDDGDVTLDNVTVLGNTHILGGGSSSIYIMDTRLGKVRIEKKNKRPVRLVYVGNSKTREIDVNTNATIETDRLRRGAEGIGSIYIPRDVLNEIELKLIGLFNYIEIAGDAYVTLISGSIKDMLVLDDVEATISAIRNAVIANLLTNSDIRVNGKTIAAGMLAIVNAIGEVIYGGQQAAATSVPTSVPLPYPVYPTIPQTESTTSPGTTFFPVTGIYLSSYVYSSGSAIDLNDYVTVDPNYANYKGINWSLNDNGRPDLASLSGSLLTIRSLEQFMLTATIENGRAIGLPFVENFYVSAIDESGIPVSDLHNTAVTATTASFAWTSTIGAASVELRVATSEFGLFEKANYAGILDNNSYSVMVTGLEPDKTYWFKLVAVGGLNSGTSNTATATTEKTIPNVSTGLFATLADKNTITLTLTNGTFKTPLTLADFEFTGANVSKLTTASCAVVRVSDTIVRFNLSSETWAASSDNIISIQSAALNSGSSATTVAAELGNYYTIGGNVDSGQSNKANAGLWVELRTGSITGSLAGRVQTDVNGDFSFPAVYAAGTYVAVLQAYTNSSVTVTLAGNVTNCNITIALSTLGDIAAPILSDKGIVTWTNAANAVEYDVLLYKAGILTNTLTNVSSGVNVLGAMSGNGVGEYKVAVRARAAGFEDKLSAQSIGQTIGKLVVSNLAYDDQAKKATWSTVGSAAGYTVKIYAGTANKSLVKTYEILTDTKEQDISGYINSAPAGTYTFTVQPRAVRDAIGAYTSVFMDGDESVSANVSVINGTINVSAGVSPAQTGVLIPAAIDVDSSFTLNTNDTKQILALPGVKLAAGSDADVFKNTYSGYFIKDWTVTGATHAVNGWGMTLTVPGNATGSINVTANFEDSKAVPFFIAVNSGTFNIGHIVPISTGFAVAKDPTRFDSEGLVYLVTKDDSFSFKDASRGGIEYTYTYDSVTSKWIITATVTNYEMLTVAINKASATDPMAKVTTIVKLGNDIIGTGQYKFGIDNTYADYPMIIDGNNKNIDFGLFFGNATNVTVKDLIIDLTNTGSKAAKSDTVADTAAVFFEGGSNIMFTNVKMNTPASVTEGVYIGTAITGKVTIAGCEIDSKSTGGYHAGIYVSTGAFTNVSITDNTIKAGTPMAIDLGGMTLDASNINNISGNTLSYEGYEYRDSNVNQNFDDFERHVYVQNIGNVFNNVSITKLTSGITLGDYFGGLIPDFFNALRGTNTAFDATVYSGDGNTGGSTNSVARIKYGNSAWTLHTYVNVIKFTNDTAISAVNLNTTTGLMTITTTGTIPPNVTVDFTKLLLSTECWLTAPGGTDTYTKLDSADEVSNYILSDYAGAWYWYGNTLTVKLSSNDLGRVNGSAASKGYAFQATAGWNKATGYYDAAAKPAISYTTN